MKFKKDIYIETLVFQDGTLNQVDLSQRSGLDFVEMAYARQVGGNERLKCIM